MDDLFVIGVRFFFGLLVFIIFFIVNNGKLKKAKFSDLFSTYLGVFSLGMIVVHSLMPIIQILFPEFNRISNFSLAYDSSVIIFCIVYYIIFLVVYLYFSNALKVRGKEVMIANIANIKTRYLYFLIFLPAIISVFFILKILTQANLAELLINRIEAFRGLGGILLLSNLFIFIALFLFVKYFYTRKHKYLFLYLCTVLFMLALFTAIGSRNSFFIFIITNMCFYFIIGGRLSFFRITAYGMALLLIFTFVGLIRVRLGNIENIDVFSSLISNLVESLISVFGTDEMFRYILEHEFNDWQFGTTFLAGFSNFIPRGIWPDKPLGAGPLITNFINPGSYGIGLSGISSYTTGIITEAYMNFGYFSLVFIAPLNALVGIGIDKIKVVSFYSLCLKSYLIVMLGFAIFYSEFLGLLARALYVGFPIVLSVIFVDKFKNGSK